jgi:hypothetical protein
MMPVEASKPQLSNFRGFNIELVRAAQPTTHLPQRPIWLCRMCGGEWPCEPARERLLQDYESEPVSIAMLMWTQLEHYAFDKGEGPLSGAFDRFIAWTR